jgi:hypothetical protein
MSSPQPQQAAAHSIQVALEESCAALMALEAARTLDGERRPEAHPRLCAAVESLRAAVVNLREAQTGHTSALAYGFVARTPTSGSFEGAEPQASPRRTA